MAIPGAILLVLLGEAEAHDYMNQPPARFPGALPLSGTMQVETITLQTLSEKMRPAKCTAIACDLRPSKQCLPLAGIRDTNSHSQRNRTVVVACFDDWSSATTPPLRWSQQMVTPIHAGV